MSNSDRIIITAHQSSLGTYLRSIFKFHELFYFLCWRDIVVRYKQTALGIAWALIKPTGTMLAFAFVFGKVAKLPAEGATPYFIMVFAGLIPWQIFSSGIQQSGDSLVSNVHLISKIYFPRMIVPLSALASSLVDGLISLGLLFLLMLFFHQSISWKILVLPAFFTLGMMSSVGLGILTSAVNVLYRDFRHVIPFILQFGLFVTPVGFSSSVIPERWRLIYSLNPMVAVVDGYRWCLLGAQPELYIPGILCSALFSLVALVVGFAFFRRIESNFVDRA